MRTRFPAAPLILAAVVFPRPAVAQDTAPLVLRLTATAQSAGVGGAFVGASGIEALFANPAQTANRGLAIGLARIGGAATQASFASATAVGKVAVAAFTQWLDYGAVGFPTGPGRLTERGPDNAQSLAAGLSVATRLAGFRIGAAAKYVEERVPLTRGGVTAIDLGLGRDGSRFSFGLAVQNLGASIELADTKADLPTRLVLGANSRRVPLGTLVDFAASAAVSWERDGRINPAAGTELIYEPVAGWTATLRAGIRRVDGAGRPGLQPLSLGGSLGLDRFSVDYAFEAYRGTGGVHRIGIRIE